MRPNQQKSFSFRNNYEKQGAYRTGNEGVMKSDQGVSFPGAAIIWVLRKAVLLIEKLIVLAKFQFYKHTAIAPSMVKVPWMKLGVIGVLGLMAFKQDLSFSVGMGDVQQAQFGTSAVAEEVALRESGGKGVGACSAIWKQKEDCLAVAADDGY